jgi:HEAT repeat protein
MKRSIALVACLCALSTTAAAENKPSGASATRAPERRSLRSLFGVDAVRPLLRAETGETRERGFERLGELGTPRALELLARALDTDGAARDARERLAVVRALAAHAADPVAADALIRALGGLEGHADARAILVERTAALALAASHDSRALAALALALRQPGRVSEDARLALRAHPPENVSAFIASTSAATPALAALLGELGDARAREFVAKLALDGDARVRVEAVRALFRLDRGAGVAFAERAFESESDPQVRAALGRVLAEGHSPLAARAFAALLADARTRTSALKLALDLENPDFGPALARLPRGDDADLLFTALARQGGGAALARLESALARPEDAWSVLYALALSPDPDADASLARALGRPALRRDAVRAAALRHAVHERNVSGTTRALGALLRGDAADRAAAAFCKTVLEPERAASLLSNGTAAEVRAAARAANTSEFAVILARRLAHEKDPSLRAALAVSLAEPSAAAIVPEELLVELVETGGAATYIAAYALAGRDSEALRPRLRQLLASDDAVLRAHVALGLARSAEPSVVGLLAELYRDETEAQVRHAIVRALAAREEPARRRTLALAATLEPDDDARELARAALGTGSRPKSGERRGTAWLHLAPASEPSFAVLEGANDLALPFAADPDGNVTVFGLPAGNVELSLGLAAPGRAPLEGASP